MSKLLNLASKSLFVGIISLAIYDLPQAEAREILSYQEYQYSCGKYNLKNNLASNNCINTFKVLTPQSTKKRSQFIFASKSNNLQYQESISNDTGIADYLVSTILSVYFPTLETLKAHSGGSFFGGIKLRENIRLDAEIVGIFDGNSLEKTYFDLSTFLNLRFSLPLKNQTGYPLLYLSPGVGISELDERFTDLDDEDTVPTWQIEGGVAIPINRNLGGYGGIKYVNQISETGNNFLGGELGIIIRL